jgi:hypothetical protein
MQIVYKNQLLNVPRWKLTSDALTFFGRIGLRRLLYIHTFYDQGISKIHADGHGPHGNYVSRELLCRERKHYKQIYLIIITKRQLSFNEIAEKIRIEYMFRQSLGSSLQLAIVYFSGNQYF